MKNDKVTLRVSKDVVEFLEDGNIVGDWSSGLYYYFPMVLKRTGQFDFEPVEDLSKITNTSMKNMLKEMFEEMLKQLR